MERPLLYCYGDISNNFLIYNSHGINPICSGYIIQEAGMYPRQI